MADYRWIVLCCCAESLVKQGFCGFYSVWVNIYGADNKCTGGDHQLNAMSLLLRFINS